MKTVLKLMLLPLVVVKVVFYDIPFGGKVKKR